MNDLLERVKKGVESEKPIEEIRDELLNKGYLVSDVDNVIAKLTSSPKERNQQNKIIGKEFLDRIGFGFSSQQYLNILFLNTGATYLIIGLINGLRVLLNSVIAMFLRDINQGRLFRKYLGYPGIIFGFSLFLLIFARMSGSVPLFAFSLILGSIGLIVYGDQHTRLSSLFNKTSSHTMRWIAQYGLLITAASIFFAGLVLELVPETGMPLVFTFLGYRFSWTIYGYLLVFELAAISFILSGNMIATLKNRIKITALPSRFTSYSEYLQYHMSVFMRDRILVVLLVTSAIMSIVNVMGASFYGVFIYQFLSGTAFGGYINVGIIFTLATIASFLGPSITRPMTRAIGNFPMLVFGVLLMAIMPLAYYFNPNIYSIALATVIGVIGASIVGTAQGLLIGELVREEYKKAFFSISNVMIIIPSIVLIPLLSYVAALYSLRQLFLLLALILIFIVAPVYFFVVLWHQKKNLMV